MSEVSWLRKLQRRAFPRGRPDCIQVGLYRSASRLIAARVRLDAGAGSTVEQFQTVAIGMQRDEEAFRRLIQSGIFSGAQVILALGPEQYNTYPVTAPSVPEAELNEALRWQLRELLPYAPEDAVIAAIRLVRAEDASTPQNLLVVAAQRRTVAHVVSPLVSAGIAVMAVDIPEMAQRNLLATLPGSDSGQALLSLDQESGLFTVIKQAELCFARRIQMPRSNALEEEDPEHIAVRVATQVQRSVEVVERQTGLAPIQTIWIGPHPYAALIARCTAEQTGIDCPQLDLPSEVRFACAVPDLDPEAAAGALLAIGAALRVDEADVPRHPGLSADSLSWLTRHEAAA